MRGLIVRENVRPDGRGPSTVRPIACRAGVLPRVHGSALFTRGETQVLATATLGNIGAAQYGETLEQERDESRQHFYLQYFFPPSSVGETGRVGGAGRREIGHGKLAERSLEPAAEDLSGFPYVVRVESHVTDSNGSSSMASVCGACLAMEVRLDPCRVPLLLRGQPLQENLTPTLLASSMCFGMVLLETPDFAASPCKGRLTGAIRSLASGS